ncbi:MAG TPA: PLP-dependent aspartate aminotransferase family protein [Polyangiaceae bacterium]|jgi:cystathionine gamma-synthase/cystathionine gamma-lyase|nr:PLP-dependent aspartate aminotransferase family protein [Polyangiaceae bacterium]
MIDKKQLGPDTLAIHAGQDPDPTSGAVMMPIVLSSTFAQESPGRHKGFEYSRSGNPTRNALEACIAALEGGSQGFAFSSGCGATVTLLHALGAGGHAVSGDDVYGGTFRIFDKVMRPLGLETTFVDMTDPGHVKKALRPNTKLIWLETPSNPLLKIFDIQAIAEIGKAAGVPVFVDNTFATPILQKPLELGATAVVHSTTKYINGHSDVVGGAVVTSDAGLAERLRFLQNAMGAVPSPFDCYLVLRGLKTLPVRMRQHVTTAQALAERLAQHPSVRRVYYPGLRNDPGHALAARQMKGPGGMISFEVDGGLGRAQKLLENLAIFACAESLGGVESLAEHPASMTHASIPREIRDKIGISDGLVRLSVGLESEADLWADVESALSIASAV